MKYLMKLQQKKLFSLSDTEAITGNLLTAKSLLQSYKKAGYIVTIRRNLYATLDLASQAIQASRYEIGSAVNEGAYISHHSALEYYGISNQVFHTVTVSTKERFSSFICEGVTYAPYQSKIVGGVVIPPTSPLVRVTDMERTVVDCIFDLDHAGGLEEVLEALRLLPGLNTERVLHYLEEYGQIFLWQKAGFILEQFAQELNIDQDFFDYCKSKINNRKKYLTEDAEQVYYRQWKLYAPPNLRRILGDGGDELV